MWKYVSRRVKDVYDKTYNVLDLRRTRFPGQIDGISSPSSQPAGNTANEHHLIRNSSLARSSINGNDELCFLYLHNRHNGSHSKSSKSSRSEDFNKDYYSYARLQSTWIGALTWVCKNGHRDMIICGYYRTEIYAA
jgi:hypothetical protein